MSSARCSGINTFALFRGHHLRPLQNLLLFPNRSSARRTQTPRPAPGARPAALPASMVHLLVRLLQVPRVSGGVRCLSFRDWLARLGTVSSGLARVVARDGLSFFKAAYRSPVDGPHLFVRLLVDARVVPVF